MGAFTYADYIILLAPTKQSMHGMLNTVTAAVTKPKTLRTLEVRFLAKMIFSCFIVKSIHNWTFYDWMSKFYI